MSLILEALRKLEREKAAPGDRGLVVLGSAGGGGGRRPAGRAVLAALVAVAVGALGALVWQRLGRAPAPPDPTASETVANEPAPAASPLEAVPAPRAGAPAQPPPGEPATSGSAQPPTADTSSAPSVTTAPVATPTPALRLQAITRRDGQPVALVNERLVREGDSFDGIRVVRIGEMEVELETPSGSVVLRF